MTKICTNKEKKSREIKHGVRKKEKKKKKSNIRKAHHR
jgi:hypothetical protein